MAWRRYADASRPGTKKYGYAQFCALFADYLRTNDLVATLHHEPGRAMLVDFKYSLPPLIETHRVAIARRLTEIEARCLREEGLESRLLHHEGVDLRRSTLRISSLVTPYAAIRRIARTRAAWVVIGL